MKRYAVLMAGLVIIDQLAQWWAYVAFPMGRYIQTAGDFFVQVGHIPHAVPIVYFAPIQLGVIAALFAVAMIVKRGAKDSRYTLFGLPIALCASALVDQVISMLTRGYTVDWFGYGIYSLHYGWWLKLTDIAYECGGILLAVLAIYFVVRDVKRYIYEEGGAVLATVLIL